MYVTRMFLDTTCRQVRKDKSDPESLHKTVMRLFPDEAGETPRKAFGVLHRIDEAFGDRVMLMVQSAVVPEVVRFPSEYLLRPDNDLDLAELGITENPAIRDVSAERSAIVAGSRFRFRLRANTTKRLGIGGDDGNRGVGKRVPVRGDEARIHWLRRRSEKSGFSIVDVSVREVAAQGARVRLAGATFDGVLEVTDADTFRQSLATGIGPAKAFGFGLLSVRRI